MEGAEIRVWREAVGISQSALASQLQVSANTVARWERDEMSIPPYLGLALAELRRQLSSKNARPKSADYIKGVMERQNLTVKMVSERANRLGYKISPSYIHSLFVGAVLNPGLGSIQALAAGLGCPEDELIDVFAKSLKPRKLATKKKVK